MARSQSLDRAFTFIRSAEFFSIELALLIDGGIYVSMAATTVDDHEAQLLAQEIVRKTAATVEDALVIIKEGLTRPL